MIKNYVDIPVPDTYVEFADEENIRCRGIARVWAKKNCPSYITNDVVEINGRYHYRFYFAQERDQVAFALRWS